MPTPKTFGGKTNYLSRYEPKPRPPAVAYGISITVTIAATLLRDALNPLIGETAVPFITYFPAVLLVAWYSGFRAALLCVALSALLGKYFFVSRTGSLVIENRGDQITLILFVLVGIGIAMLAHSQRIAL